MSSSRRKRPFSFPILSKLIGPLGLPSRLLSGKKHDPLVVPAHSSVDSFTKAPVDILIMIMQELDDRSLLNCSATCKALCSLVNTVTELRYTLVLAAEGASRKRSDKSSIGERLQRLLVRRARWRALDWSHFEVLKIPRHGRRFHINYTNGVFFSTIPGGQLDIATIFIFFPPNNGIVSPSIRIDDFSLPQDAPLGNYLSPPAPNLDMNSVDDLFVHPALDLLILLKTGSHPPEHLSYDLHLRSLKSAGRLVHPRCTFAIIHDTFPETSDGTHGAMIRVLGDLVALQAVSGFNKYVCVWNWTTGEKLAQAHDDTPFNIRDLTFIPSDILIASVSSHDGRSAMIWIYSLKDGLITSQFDTVPLMRPLVLHLPTFSDQGMTLVSMTCTTDNPAEYSWDGPHSPMPPAVAFNLRTTRPDVRFGVFDTLWTLMVMRGSSFSSLMQTYASGTRARRTGPLAWEEWGPIHTRLFAPKVMDWPCWVRPILGMISNGRIVVPPETTAPINELGPLELVDFHVGRYKPHELVSTPSTISSPLFKHSVTSSLPYYTTPIPDHTRMQVPRFGDFILGDDCLMNCPSMVMRPDDDHFTVHVYQL
ncbi:hypothetical protein DENSPDRAFT_846115 [Dentipellis sp. KUC8613]|nr:hypothetical protein DENSPDRAFT_846115 [Dentipellis sp. KUC8613]